MGNGHWREEKKNKSRKVLFIGGLCMIVLVCWWILLGDGYSIIGRQNEDYVQSILVLSMWIIYLLRVIYGTFFLLPRSVSWEELGSVWVFVSVIMASTCMGVIVGSKWEPSALLFATSISLYLLGSFITTWSEQKRAWWKRKPENKGRLYTEHYFAVCRHPNYLGDLILFSGFSLMTRVWWNFWIPLAMLLGFIFHAIPDNESYLASKYNQWMNYTKQTPFKLIPYVY